MSQNLEGLATLTPEMWHDVPSQEEDKFSSITEVDQDLIHRIHMMLIVINSDHVIDVEAFKKYGFETAERWVELYDWYKMPVSLHQLFFHAWESLHLSHLPISSFTEQSLESCNNCLHFVNINKENILLGIFWLYEVRVF